MWASLRGLWDKPVSLNSWSGGHRKQGNWNYMATADPLHPHSCEAWRVLFQQIYRGMEYIFKMHTLKVHNLIVLTSVHHWNYHHNQNNECIHDPWKCPHVCMPLLPALPPTPDSYWSFLSPQVSLRSLEFYTHEIVRECVRLRACLFQQSYFKVIHLAACSLSPLQVTAEQHSTLEMGQGLFACSPVSAIELFPFFEMANKVAKSVPV